MATAAEHTTLLAAFTFAPLKATSFLEAIGRREATKQGCDRTELEHAELDRVFDSIVLGFLFPFPHSFLQGRCTSEYGVGNGTKT